MEAASRASCDGSRRRTAVVSGQSGYLAGVWAAETGCGTVDAPWQVRVEPGQRINVTVFDFTVPASTDNARTSSAVAQPGTVSAGMTVRLANRSRTVIKPTLHSFDLLFLFSYKRQYINARGPLTFMLQLL